MTTKYEVIEINGVEITVDVSLLIKTEELFFNATEMAKPFDKRPDDFWKQEQNKEYLEALITLSEGNKNREDFVQTKRGKFGGTYFHNDLALHFATEADLINRIVLGMPAKKFKKYYEVDNVRDACTAAQLQDLNKLQSINTTLINLGMDYATRKDVLTRYQNGETNMLSIAA